MPLDMHFLLEDYISTGYKALDLVFFFNGNCSDLGVPNPSDNLKDLRKKAIDEIAALNLPHAVLGDFFRVLQK
jgi:hypothetical protein